VELNDEDVQRLDRIHTKYQKYLVRNKSDLKEYFKPSSVFRPVLSRRQHELLLSHLAEKQNSQDATLPTIHCTFELFLQLKDIEERMSQFEKTLLRVHVRNLLEQAEEAQILPRLPDNELNK